MEATSKKREATLLPSERRNAARPTSSSDLDYTSESLSPIQRLLLYPALFDPVRTPRYPLVLCHGA